MPEHDFRSQRLFVDADLAAGAAVRLPAEQAHYVANVIRLAVGETILLFNGRDGEWRARRIAGGKRDVALEVEAQVRPQPASSRLEYAFAPLKHARLDYMVQKAVSIQRIRLTAPPLCATQCDFRGIDMKQAGLTGLLVGFVVAPKHGVHAGLMASTLGLKPVDHIGIELGVDVGFERRQLKHGISLGQAVLGLLECQVRPFPGAADAAPYPAGLNRTC